MKECGVIIDFDNTLAATNAFIEKHLGQTCKNIGVLAPEHEILMAKLKENPPFEKIFLDLFGEKGAEILAAYRETAMNTPYQATEGGVEFVKTVFEQGISIVIASNRTRMLSERLEQAKYRKEWFLDIVECDPKKPEVGAYSGAISKFNASKEIIIIGDHPDDYLACPDYLRVSFIALLTGLTTAEEFEQVRVSKDKIWQKLDYQKFLAI